jgi:hypothetical protein
MEVKVPALSLQKAEGQGWGTLEYGSAPDLLLPQDDNRKTADDNRKKTGEPKLPKVKRQRRCFT